MKLTRRELLRDSALAAGVLWASRAGGDIGSADAAPRYWLLLIDDLTEKTRDVYRQIATSSEFSKIQAFSILTHGPAFPGYDEAFRTLANQVSREAQRSLIYASFTVGTEGWETSNNNRLAAHLGVSLGKAVPREQWFEELMRVKAAIYGITIESLAKPPSPDQLADYLRAFATAAHKHGAKAAAWYAANWERFKTAGAIVRPALEAAAASLDYIVWMDTRTLLQDTGEAGFRRRVGDVKQLTKGHPLFQLGLFGSEQEAYTTSAEIMDLAAAGGVNSFALFVPAERLKTDRWKEFYGGLK